MSLGASFNCYRKPGTGTAAQSASGDSELGTSSGRASPRFARSDSFVPVGSIPKMHPMSLGLDAVAAGYTGRGTPPAAVDPPSEPPVVVESAQVRHGRDRLLGPLTLKVVAGEFIGILGPNGSGKSTLISLLNATHRPCAGVVRLLGVDPWSGLREGVRSHLRARIGTVLQRNDYNPSVPLLARDVVAIGALGRTGLTGRLSTGDVAQIEHAMDRLEISHLARRQYALLSGGEQQKVQFARVLVQQPELLLLDEPTSGLDLDWQERMVQLIDSLSRELRIPIVMTTHLVGHLPRCCQRVVLVQDGHVLYDGPVADALAPERLGELYGCPMDVIEHEGRRYCLARGAGPR